MQIRRRPFSQNFAGNPILYGWFDEEAANNPDILFEVRVQFKNAENLAAWQLLANVPLTPVGGSAEIDISHILKTYLEPGIPSLDTSFTESVRQTGVFYVEYRRISIGGVLNEAWNASEAEYLRQVIWGGIHPYMWRGNNFWVNYFAGENKFLTWQVNNRLAAFTEKIFLAWFNNTNVPVGNIKVFSDITYTDASKTQLSTMMPATGNRVYFIAAGAGQLGIPVPEGKKLWYWSVTVQDITVPDTPVNISQVFTFQLDNRKDYNYTTLHYRNSLGGLDSVRIRGAIEINITLDGSDAESAAFAWWPFAYTLHTFDRSLPHREIVAYKGEIGHLGKEEQDRLRDAFLNREVYQENHGRLWPIKLLSKQYRLRLSNDKRFTLPIEWVVADGGSYYYTPDISLGSGLNYTNVCAATVGNINYSLAYQTSDVGRITWTWDVNNPSTDNVTKVQWKVPGFIEEWQDYPYPYQNPLETFHAAPGNYTFYFRAVCEGGSPGAITAKAVHIPAYDPDPGPDPEPETNNSNIYNNTGVNTPLTVTVNGVIVYDGVVDSGSYASFNAIPGQIVVQVVIQFVTPDSATLTTQNETVEGYIRGPMVGGRSIVHFAPGVGINNISGVIIELF